MEKKINCLVVDDEPLARQVLEKHIARDERLFLAAKAGNASEAFSLLHEHSIDLIFLDIKMPAVKGTDFIASLKNPPAFIFTTAFSEYAMKGYELEALDYLLKPITEERFQKSIDKFFKIYKPEQEQEKQYLYLKVNGELKKVFFSAIHYAESLKDYVKVKTDKEVLITHMTMKSMEDLLPDKDFVRIHRSYIVNKNKLDIIGRGYVKVSGQELPVGENYKANIIQK